MRLTPTGRRFRRPLIITVFLARPAQAAAPIGPCPLCVDRVRFLWILLPIQLEQVLRCSKVPRRRSSTVCKRSCLSYSVRMALQLARPSVLMCQRPCCGVWAMRATVRHTLFPQRRGSQSLVSNHKRRLTARPNTLATQILLLAPGGPCLPECSSPSSLMDDSSCLRMATKHSQSGYLLR